MKLSIRHETIYRYAASQAYSIQQLHVTPRLEAQQNVLTWNLQAPGAVNAYTDAYGNRSHMLTLNEPHRLVAIVAEGIVHTTLLDGGRLHNSEPLSPLVFTVPTRLTMPTGQISEYASASLAEVREGRASTGAMLALAERIRASIAYVTGATSVDTTAHDALLQGAGVCQDHAHLFLACCHAMGVPARYVSGYIDPGSSGHAASHAWVDAWVHDAGFEGWISIDVTHARLMTDAYCRLAIGRDYVSAAPVRGSRRGAGEETMAVNVQIVPV
ncbi:transglutaminase family protein [Massilia sp. DWR3-1-1]|uniref:transglutaminase family protein n=1 Tax=Massilia sp. DWR3-1-1 TaxID=2804559 RepID=UPI003CF5F012